MADVVLQGVSRVFPGGTVAVNRIELSIPDGQFMVLVGPSGCGKSTTLRMIAGLEQVSSGQISIGGRVVNDELPKDRDIAMVFQNYALYPHMSVRQNLSFALKLRHGGLLKRLFQRVTSPTTAAETARRQAEIEQRVRDVAAKLGIERLLDRRPRELSGGERQRVALGRALVREPVAYLFDEPLSNLDARLRLDMRRELKQLHTELQSTMIYVTHDQVEALTLGDRIAVMRDGEIQQVGTPQEVYNQPRNRFVAGFIGSPPMNFVEGRVVSEQDDLSIDTGSGSVAVDSAATKTLQRRVGDQVVLGFRPEVVRLADRSVGSKLRLSGQVILVEPLGDATIIHVSLSAAQATEAPAVLCRAQPDVQVSVDDQVELEVDSQRIHCFEVDSGESLTAASARAIN